MVTDPVPPDWAKQHSCTEGKLLLIFYFVLLKGSKVRGWEGGVLEESEIMKSSFSHDGMAPHLQEDTAIYIFFFFWGLLQALRAPISPVGGTGRSWCCRQGVTQGGTVSHRVGWCHLVPQPLCSPLGTGGSWRGFSHPPGVVTTAQHSQQAALELGREEGTGYLWQHKSGVAWFYFGKDLLSIPSPTLRGLWTIKVSFCLLCAFNEQLVSQH